MVKVYEDKYPDSIFISASKNINIETLLNKFQELYDRSSNNFRIFLPYEEAGLIQKLFSLTEIVEQNDDETGSYYKLKVQDDSLFHFKNIFDPFIVENEK
jgi:GTP-binding protein HflX